MLTAVFTITVPPLNLRPPEDAMSHSDATALLLLFVVSWFSCAYIPRLSLRRTVGGTRRAVGPNGVGGLGTPRRRRPRRYTHSIFQGTRRNVDVRCEVRNGFGGGNKTLCDSVSCRFLLRYGYISRPRVVGFRSLRIIINSVFMPSNVRLYLKFQRIPFLERFKERQR